MRQDQYDKLQALSERLTDVFLDEAEPDNWPGSTMPIDQIDKQMRGDRYWCKKNAVATISIIAKVASLTTIIREHSNKGAGAAGVTDEEATLDAEIASAEKQASKLLDELQRRFKKSDFDKRVHGKA